MRLYRGLVFAIALPLLSACGPSAASYNNAGNRNFEQEKYEEALGNYDEAKQEDPTLAEPYYNSGNTLHRQGELESASDQLRQSVHADDSALAQKSLYNLGNTYFKGQSWQEAIDAYVQALLLDPNDVDAKNNLELALQQQQQQQQQQQNQGGGDQQQQQQQQQPSQEPQENQGQSNGQSENEEPQDQSGQNQEEQQQPQPSQGELSPEEAKQLLDALGQDSQTLQERLQQQHGAPAIPPAQDW